jgi:two-component system, chemotaxis family, chemotaxis protein CheY
MKKLLIVEDSSLHQKIYDIIFSKYRGVIMLHAGNGQEGLNMLAMNPDTSLVILDVNMPVMSGLEFLGHMKNEKVLKDIPVIICSTEGNEEDILRGLRAGAAGYVKKPFQPDSLLNLVSRITGTE